MDKNKTDDILKNLIDFWKHESVQSIHIAAYKLNESPYIEEIFSLISIGISIMKDFSNGEISEEDVIEISAELFRIVTNLYRRYSWPQVHTIDL